MTVVMYEAGLTAFFGTESGPWGQYLSRHAAAVDTRAHAHATGRPGPNIRSQALIQSIRWAGLFRGVEGLEAQIVVDARSPRGDYAYPYALETGIDPVSGRPVPYGPYPFMMPALRDEFPDFRPV